MSTEQIIGTLAVGVICWMAKTLISFAREMTEWRVILFGKDGNNGMRGIQKDHETRIRALEDAA